MLRKASPWPACLALMAWAGPVAAQQAAAPGAPADVPLEALRQQVADQMRQLDALKRMLSEQESRYRELRRAVGIDTLASQRGGAAAAAGDGGAAAAAIPTQAGPPLAPQVAQGAQGGDGPRAVRVAPAAGTAPAAAQAQAQAAAQQEQPLQSQAVAPLFEQPGILTPRGKMTFEPSFQYGYSSNNRVALVGYTVIPALLIGLVDVREVKRNTLTGAVAFRYGLTNRFEVEAKLPYVYRSDATISREIFTGTANENAFSTSGKSVGDIEATARYQLNDGSGGKPYMVGSLRVKSRTGKDPFEVVTDCVTRCVGNATGTGLPTELPTGSGFYSLQPGLTWLLASDPAVFFGSFSYTYNVKRTDVSRRVLGGESEYIGTVAPGGIFGVNFGMGLAINEKSSFSIGIDLNSLGPTKQNGVRVPSSVRTQLATLLLGYSYRYDSKTSFSVSVGAGLTRDTPDLTLNVRVPISIL
ncbi:MAG: acetate kinase [Xylophilus ampelinus]